MNGPISCPQLVSVDKYKNKIITKFYINYSIFVLSEELHGSKFFFYQIQIQDRKFKKGLFD